MEGSGSESESESKCKSVSTKRHELFGDCALIEIIHLHDCLRGALQSLQRDVTELSEHVKQDGAKTTISELERRVAGRFKVIWSVFRSHSAAEDEFIWPALQNKAIGAIHTNPSVIPAERKGGPKCDPAVVEVVEQEEYVEDHADEERMFETMDKLLVKLHMGLEDNKEPIRDISTAIDNLTGSLLKHLMEHLDKEETRCMPLVKKHLTKDEIHDLVGQIMGKRSSDTIAQIMTMAVQNLNKEDQEQMIRYMKQAMVGTFFEKWLSMSGWMSSAHQTTAEAAQDEKKHPAPLEPSKETSVSKRAKTAEPLASHLSPQSAKFTSQAELEKLIRAIMNNKALTPVQRNTTIQGLRDSVWKSNTNFRSGTASRVALLPAKGAAVGELRRETPASSYFRKDEKGETVLVWTRDLSNNKIVAPLFDASELAPTYHDGFNGAVLGCPHYARSCKLRHPGSGRLYTCRLCCEQERENPLKPQDSPLDRYSVKEIYCMRCGTLQPASSHCVNPSCDPAPFAKYFCSICNLYDDGPNKNIYHCPFCNVCRTGKGLGIDYRHCMRCNACVSLADDDHHCIPQRLQATCPICSTCMFQSTEPLKGLKCGHVMHLSCFNMYMRGHSYTCPLCKKSVEDMKEYFAMLDAAVRMQPMPAAYQSTVSNIYCQDCCQTGQVRYHFVGCKCPHCGSYNTRELGREQQSSTSHPQQT